MWKMKDLSEKLLDTESGNSVVVAMDHGLHEGVYEGFENPESTLDKVLESSPDGILVGTPFLERFEKKLSDAGVKKVATLDLMRKSTIPGKNEGMEIQTQVFKSKEAAKLDADAVKVALIFGREDPKILENNLKYIARIAENSKELEIPVIVEPTLWGKKIEEDLNADMLAHASRIAFELGADIIKSPYPGDAKSFRPIVENSPVPVLIAGGPKVETDAEVLEMVKGGVKSGCRGVIFGRNIWQRENPKKMISAIKTIVHEGASVQESLKALEK